MNVDKLVEQLIDFEGEKFKPYKDTVGKVTIGVGRNLTDKGISKAESRVLLHNDIADAVFDLDKNLPWWDSMTEARQRVLADMCFNMGITTLLTFSNTLSLMKKGDYAGAAAAMRESHWASQVGRRADALAGMMERGI